MSAIFLRLMRCLSSLMKKRCGCARLTTAIASVRQAERCCRKISGGATHLLRIGCVFDSLLVGRLLSRPLGETTMAKATSGRIKSAAAKKSVAKKAAKKPAKKAAKKKAAKKKK